MLVRIANREGPDQTALSHLGLHSALFFLVSVWQATRVRNFRVFNILQQNMKLFFTQYCPIKAFDERNLAPIQFGIQ